jgi:hypothetical protein
MSDDNGFYDFYTMGSEVIINHSDDTGKDHQEVAIVWVRTGDYIITSNGRVITASSELNMHATGIKFPMFSVSDDALKVYENIRKTGCYENFDSQPE